MEAGLVLAIGLRDRALVNRLQSRFPQALDRVPALACYCVWEPSILASALQAGADVAARDRVMQAAPLHWAIKCNQPESLQRLLTHGADPDAVLAIGDAAATPLLMVAQQLSDCSLEMVELLLQHGAEPNWQMHNGYTAMDILDQRWGKRPLAEYEQASGVVRQFGGKTARELATLGAT